jgi:hypothetical protein
MLYTIFLYDSKSGLLLYDKNFQEISDGKMELFSSFFSALKSFISEMILDGEKQLKNIELGDYSVLITSVGEIGADLVVIGDKDDQKLINKFIPKLIKVLLKYRQIFIDWQGKRDDFNILDAPISDLILSHKKLLGEKTLIEHPELVLKSMWAHKKEIDVENKRILSQEREILIERMENSNVLPNKLVIAEKLLYIAEKLKDDKDFINYQEEIKKIKDEIRDTKIKLNYYLDKIKSTINQAVNILRNKPLNDGDYKDVYINLYSFSNKLKNMIENNKWQEYRDLAQTIINKDEVSTEKLSEAISLILKMNNNIEYYLN